MDCVFIDEGLCSAAAVEIDPDTGCATYSPSDESAKEDKWDAEEEGDEWEEEDAEEDDEEWLDDEEDEF
jgi:hypothetical protein